MDKKEKKKRNRQKKHKNVAIALHKTFLMPPKSSSYQHFLSFLQ